MSLYPPPAASQTLRRARLATTLVFLINGALFGNWVTRIPQIQEKLGISEGQLGLALLALGFGALISLVLAGWMVVRFGSRPVNSVVILMVCLVFPLPALAPTWALLSLALFACGIGYGVLDVAMNSQGVLIQRRLERPILSSMHAAFSLGAFGGSLIGGVIAAIGASPAVHLTGVAVIAGIAGLFICRWLLDDSDEVRRGGPSFVRPSRVLAALGILAFCGLLVEGAVADWSAVYLTNTLGTGPGLAAVGYAAFSLTMGVGRLVGDRLVFLTSAIGVARWGGVISTAGMLMALIPDNPYLVIAGFGLVGAGMANVVPIVFSAAGRMPGMEPAPAIAAVASTGYVGFLLGPSVIGLTAELITLRGALVLLLILSTTAVLLAGSVRR